MFGRKKMIPAGFAAMGILIAAMAFVGGCGTQPDFWEQEIDGKVPAEQLETIISQDLTENYAIKHLAVEGKVTEDYTFEDLKAQMEEKNDAQSDSVDTTDSYGLTEYDISKYYSYWYSNLQTKLMNQMIGNSKDYSDAQDVEAYITEKAEKSVIRPGGASATDVILETFAQ